MLQDEMTRAERRAAPKPARDPLGGLARIPASQGAPLRYFDELKRSMEYLATDPRTVFIGQAVAVAGTGMSNTLKGVDASRLIELPVAEEMQMGMTTGMALAGLVPVSIFPRWNFLLCGMSQLVNHLDKLGVMSNGGYAAKAIVRTSIGSERPLHPQHQHVGDYTEALRLMCSTIEVIRLDEPDDIFPAYERALRRDDGRSTLIVEYGDYYSEK
jgi:pyruvate/2-oxoglutarate/acetoin dehydrogenase E1 component